MVSVVSLWLPILLSAVLVFIASSIIHVFLTYHRSDFKGIPSEDQVMDALRPFTVPPGDYVIPHAENPAAMKSPEFLEKVNRGPVAFMTVLPNTVFNMGTSLTQWFVYCIVVGVFAAYVTGLAVGPGAEYMRVFRFVGTTAFIGYALALWQNSIWAKRAWSITLKWTFDGLIYALVTAGTFGWLWPT